MARYGRVSYGNPIDELKEARVPRGRAIRFPQFTRCPVNPVNYPCRKILVCSRFTGADPARCKKRGCIPPWRCPVPDQVRWQLTFPYLTEDDQNQVR